MNNKQILIEIPVIFAKNQSIIHTNRISKPTHSHFNPVYFKIIQ